MLCSARRLCAAAANSAAGRARDKTLAAAAAPDLRAAPGFAGASPRARKVSSFQRPTQHRQGPRLAAHGACVAASGGLAAAWLAAERPASCEEAEEHWTVELLAKSVDDLPAGYKARTTNPLTVVRKRRGPPPVPGEKLFTQDEVAEHSTPDDMWVTYQDGVYDVTEFCQEHPGGAKFLHSVAGGAIDGMWAYWHAHHRSKEPVNILKRIRVGRLSDWEGDETEGVDMFDHEPERPPTQVVLYDRPWQTETRPDVLAGSFLTPNSALYVRNHAPVPMLSAGTHRVAFASEASCCKPESEEVSFTIAELEQKHGLREITSILQCTGNRAADNIAANGPSNFSGTNDENIQAGMLGNVRWSGVSLASVLAEHFGIDASRVSGPAEGPDAVWVEFQGADGYRAAVPLAHVMDPTKDCMLATRQNGEPLLPDHGFPVRVMLPGIAGARNVKWVERIVIQDGEGDSPWNITFYKNKTEPLQRDGRRPSCLRLPLNSVIMAAKSDGKGRVSLEGVAYPGSSGEEIASVEASVDRGQSWHSMQIRQAESEQPDDSSRHWHWVRWHGTMAVVGQEREVWCRASTKQGSVQPEKAPPCGGYLYNGWHKRRAE